MNRKKIIIALGAITVLAVVILLLVVPILGKKSDRINMEPKVSQMKSICELAVMDCYYHNVAKFKQENATGWWLWAKDKHFWIEYSGIVRLGIDASLLNLDISGNIVTVSIPEVKVLGCKVDSKSLTKESYIVSADSAKITAEDEVKAFEMAQKQLEENAASDRVLLANAQQRVQNLLEDYIVNIGTLIDKEYTIKWIYLDAEGKPLNANTPTSTVNEESTSGGASQ